MEFVNSYHFSPVLGNNRRGDLPVADFRNHAAPPAAGHAAYALGTFSGRLICSIRTEDFTFIGKRIDRRATDTEPGHCEPFELEGRPAVPASTIRGLISSVAEAASNSALRILDDTLYSYRQTTAAGDTLSAIGMIIEEHGVLRLRPLTLPTIPASPGSDAALAEGLESYRTMFSIPNLKVLFGSKTSIRAPGFKFRTFEVDRPQYYYMRVEFPAWGDPTHFKKVRSDGEHRVARGRREFLIGQKSPDREPLSERQWMSLPEDERTHYTRGILRIFGCHGRDDVPETKKHEIFIPYPVAIESLTTFPIPDTVVKRFAELADQRTLSREEGDPLPYAPKGPARTRDGSAVARRFELKHGDLVYFRPTRDGSAVAEIALSSMWRGRVETRDTNGLPIESSNTHSFFRGVDSELVPMCGSRNQITMAEQVFGFVEERRKDDPSRQPILASKGKLRFSHALLHRFRGEDYSRWNSGSPAQVSPYHDQEVTLRILDSPKPPSPSLYFKNSHSPYSGIRPHELTPGRHHPQGRKFYVHHRPQDHKEPWKHVLVPDDRMSQHMEVRPFKSGAEFFFHIDFDNLTRLELGLLLYSMRPEEDFRHKLGMGKSIGMGRVRIDVLALALVDRQDRYSYEGLLQPRYHDVWFAPKPPTPREQWPASYGQLTAAGDGLDAEAFRREFREGMPAVIREALSILGRTSRIPAPVHVPAVMDQGHFPETETFRWFVANQKQRHPVGLLPLDASEGILPTLPMLEESHGPGGE